MSFSKVPYLATSVPVAVESQAMPVGDVSKKEKQAAKAAGEAEAARQAAERLRKRLAEVQAFTTIASRARTGLVQHVRELRDQRVRTVQLVRDLARVGVRLRKDEVEGTPRTRTAFDPARDGARACSAAQHEGILGPSLRKRLV